MTWFLERKSELLTCEIRHAPEGKTYEFEVAPPEGPAVTRRFSNAGELIDQYLRAQVTLKAQGWHPRVTDMSFLG